MFYVYILHSTIVDKFYVGSTEDVAARLARHNAGRSTYTSKGIPWELKFSIECESRAAAVQLEMKIKKRGIKRYLLDNGYI